MKARSIIFFATSMVVVASCTNKPGGSAGFGDNEYAVRTVSPESIELSTSYPATIRGVQDVEIRPKISGFITKVNVHEGQRVAAGQLLFVIDNETYQAQVRQAKAAVSTAKAQLETSRLTLENSKELHRNNVIGDYELATARNNLATAEATLLQSQAALASAQEMLSFCYVKSPVAGVVGELPYKAGALVSASGAEPLTTVSDISIMEAYFSVTEKDMLAMTKGEGGMDEAIRNYPPVTLRLSDGTLYSHKGSVVKASGVINAGTGTITLIARFDNPEKLLRSGGSGQIIATNVSKAAIVIPQEAVTEIQNKTFVYLVGKDNRVKYSEIKVLPQNDGNSYIVTDGMQPGSRYVARGIASLKDGVQIRPITEEQYMQKINNAAKLGEKQHKASGFIEAMKK